MLVTSVPLDLFNFYKKSGNAKSSLSYYFPKGTCYFYGYPCGDDSGFLNLVPPTTEELVSARPLVCAGGDVSVITFAEPSKQITLNLIKSQSGSRLLSDDKIITFPEAINNSVLGKQRNSQVKQCLKQMVKPGSLVMAQPYLDEDLYDLYQISPKLTNWLNDKLNMPSYIPNNLLVERYATFANGQEFADAETTYSTPCVVKVSSSSAGDGVYICKSKRSFNEVKQKLVNSNGTIILEQYIDAFTNYGVQFGIPENSNLPIDIIGINQQLTTPEGEFIGGVIDPNHDYHELAELKATLISEILPQVRELGWYGVGCFDVLSNKNGQLFVIDCNFRMTGMTAYLMMVANRQITKPLVSFSGELRGSLAEFRSVLGKLADQSYRGGLVHILTATEHDGVSTFNGALLLDNLDDIKVIAQKVLDVGISSKVLTQLCA